MSFTIDSMRGVSHTFYHDNAVYYVHKENKSLYAIIDGKDLMNCTEGCRTCNFFGDRKDISKKFVSDFMDNLELVSPNNPKNIKFRYKCVGD